MSRPWCYALWVSTGLLLSSCVVVVREPQTSTELPSVSRQWAINIEVDHSHAPPSTPATPPAPTPPVDAHCGVFTLPAFAEVPKMIDLSHPHIISPQDVEREMASYILELRQYIEKEQTTLSDAYHTYRNRCQS